MNNDNINDNNINNNPMLNPNDPSLPLGLKLLMQGGVTITPAILAALMEPSPTVEDFVLKFGKARLGPDFDLHHPAGPKQFHAGSKRHIAYLLFRFVDFFHGRKLAEITPKDAGAFLAKGHRVVGASSAKDWSSVTKAKTARILGCMFRFGMDRGICSHNPFRDLTLHLAPFVRTLRPESDITKFLETALSHDKLIFLGAVLSRTFGLRRSELLTLTWKDLDVAKQRVFVSGAKRKFVRRIPMPPTMVDLLALMPITDPNAKVIPVDAARFHRRMARIFVKASVAPFGKGELRRAYTTQVLWAGTDPALRATWLGHTKVSPVTEKFYHGPKTPDFMETLRLFILAIEKPFDRKDLR